MTIVCSEFTTIVCLSVCILFPGILALHLNSPETVDHLTFPAENVTTGNSVLYEPASGNIEPHPTTILADSQLMENNDPPVRYDEAELWRIYNISSLKNPSQMPQFLESNFGGNVWKENSNFLDVSFAKENIKKARGFLHELNVSSEVLIKNIQSLLDQEASGEDFKSTRTKKSSGEYRRMNWEEYQDIDVIYEFMKEIRLAYPELCRLYTIGKTAEGRELKVMRISENPKDNTKIWIDGGIHAREWISPAVVTHIMDNLLSNWSTLPKYLTSKTWYIMPVMNPDGYMYSRKHSRLWRKNRSKTNRQSCRGVDLNRNFDINWKGPGSSTNACSDTYRGASPGSELETQAVVKFLSRRTKNLGAYLTFHSYGEMIVYPWAYKKAKVRDHKELQAAAQLAVNNIKKETGRAYRAAPTYELLGVAGGGSDDWSRDSLGVKYVYTVELRDRGYYAFVLPKEQIKPTSKEGWAIVDSIARFF
ncbi:carboxypeptidase B-like [Episyrphus balteatus]|uniref:carboxypeptidase B-like n=1 Tax=Episyrphus balteatus TaxID=286459 RepID=UPI0024851C16|nr:carboxypeptidase B-like [Episyrphus balteatus]